MNYKKMIVCLVMTMSLGALAYGMFDDVAEARAIVQPKAIIAQTGQLKKVQSAVTLETLDAKLNALDKKLDGIMQKLGGGFMIASKDPFLHEHEKVA